MIRLKKMMAMVIAMVVVICTMSFGAFADNTTPTGNVTADPAIKVMGLETGDVAHFYQVLKWQNSGIDEQGQDIPGGWVFVAPFTSMTDKDGNAITVEMLTGNPAADPKVPMGITSAIAGVIARTASGDGTARDEVNGTATLTIDGTTHTSGLYLVLITPADADTVYNPVFVSSDYKPDAQQTDPSSSWEIATSAKSYSDQAAAKRSKLTVVKKAGTELDPQKTAEIGKTMNYTVTTTIPGYGEVYTEPHFVIHDKLTNMVLTGDIHVKGDGSELTKGATGDYTLDKGDDYFTITFTDAYLKKCSAPVSIEVTYDAIVTTDAVTFISEEDNEITIEYSHDPNKGGDFNVKKDATEHYTFTIGADALSDDGTIIKKSTTEIVKVGVDSAGKAISEQRTTSQIIEDKYQEGPLEGAVFKVYTDPDCTEEYQPKDSDGNPVDPIPEIISRSDGRITIKNLAAGTYYLKEVSSPEGYVKDTVVHSVEIKPTFEPKTVTEYYDFSDHKWYPSQNTAGTRKAATFDTEVVKTVTVIFDGNEEDPAAVHTFMNNGSDIHVSWVEGESTEAPTSIVNKQGVELPATGGIGTTIFYAIGTILVLGAGILLVTRRRMEAR